MNELNISVEDRLKNMESRMDTTDIHVEKLEQLFAQGAPCEVDAEISKQINTIKDLALAARKGEIVNGN